MADQENSVGDRADGETGAIINVTPLLVKNATDTGKRDTPGRGAAQNPQSNKAETPRAASTNRLPLRVPSDPSLLQSVISSGLVLTIATGLAYVAAYSWDVGFCTRFSIPVSLISISTTNLVATAIFAVAFACVVAPLLPLIPYRVVKRLVNIWSAVPLLILNFLGLSLMIATHQPLLPTIALALSMLTVGIFAAMIVVGAKMPFKVKHRKPRKHSDRVDLMKEMRAIRMIEHVAGTAMSVAVITFVSFAAAYFYGSNVDTWGVIAGKPPKVVLAVYGDLAVAANYDPRLRVVSTSFTIYDVRKTLPEVTMTHTGHLKSVSSKDSVGSALKARLSPTTFGRNNRDVRGRKRR